jgi:hypothetical protein
MDLGNGSFFLQDGMVKNRLVTNELCTASMHAAYYSTQCAKLSLTWFLATTVCSPNEWIPRNIESSSWKPIKYSCPHEEAETTNLRYVVVTLQNGPKHFCKGHAFCTLVRMSDRVFARIEKSDDNGVFFELANNVEGGLLATEIDNTRITDNERQKSAEADVKECNHGQTQEDRDSSEVGEHIDCNHPQKRLKRDNIVVDARISVRAPLPRRVNIPPTMRPPLEIDPFSAADFSKPEYMQERLRLWRPFWTESLLLWNSSYTPRPHSEVGDFYWQPPSTDVQSRKIRSKPNLTSFLNHCVQHETVNRRMDVDSENQVIDYELLLQTWTKRTR